MKDILDKEFNANTNDLEKLKKNFPNCFDKEGNFNISKLEDLISGETKITKESYKLDWLGKGYSRLLANSPITTMLTEDVEHNSKPENKNSNNIYIEGDNLEVLKHLKNAYSEKVKMIYIDPPYNTGSDFIYHDDRKFTVEELSNLANIEEDEAQRILDFTSSKSNSHSAWLTFMYPRLYIARELLKEDGVIFISIDEYEVFQLKLLCDEIFGEENALPTIQWKGKGGGADSATLVKTNEYIICFVKSNLFSVGTRKVTNTDYKHTDNKGRRYKLQLLRKWGANDKMEDRPNLFYPVDFEENSIIPLRPDGSKGRWRWSKERMKDEHEAGNIEMKKNKDKIILYEKIYRGEKSVKYNNWFDDCGNNAEGTKLIKELFIEKIFDTPKPVTLIKKIINIANVNENDIILDFFSGSSTTAHAVMDLNTEDKGNCKYIMVQLPEVIDPKKSKSAFDFCSDNNLEPIIPSIAKERIKRAAKKIIDENQDKEYINDLDFGFKVFKTKELENSNYLETLNKFNPNEERIFTYEKDLTKDDLYNLALTWKTQDGIPLTNGFKFLSIDSYEALFVKNKVYLMYEDFSTKQLIELLEINDSNDDIIINSIVIYGLNFTSKAIKELKEGMMINNKKSANIELEVRY